MGNDEPTPRSQARQDGRQTVREPARRTPRTLRPRPRVLHESQSDGSAHHRPRIRLGRCTADVALGCETPKMRAAIKAFRAHKAFEDHAEHPTAPQNPHTRRPASASSHACPATSQCDHNSRLPISTGAVIRLSRSRTAARLRVPRARGADIEISVVGPCEDGWVRRPVIHRSERADPLVAGLGELLAKPLADLFCPRARRCRRGR